MDGSTLEFAAALVFGAIAVAVASGHRLRRNSGYSEAAEHFGLTFEDDELRGKVDGYPLHLFHVRRPVPGYHDTLTSIGVQVELGSPPADLVLSTETVATKLGKLVGLHDLHVDDERFDREFHVKCDHDPDTEAWLSDRARRIALMDLHHQVERVVIEDGWLEFEVAGTIEEFDDVALAVRFAVDTATRIDDPTSVVLPHLGIAIRDKPNMWRVFGSGLLRGAVVLLLLSALAWGVWNRVTTAADARDREARELAFLTCVRDLPKEHDIELTLCDDALARVPDKHSPAVLEKRRVLGRLRLRRASRVSLDPHAAEAAIAQLSSMTDPSFGRADLLDAKWDAGLFSNYLAAESLGAPRLTAPALMMALQQGRLAELEAGDERGFDETLDVWRCAYGLPILGLLGRDHREELQTACSKTTGEFKRSGRASHLHALLSALEESPESELEGVTKLVADRQPRPELTLYLTALRLAEGVDPATDLARLAEQLETPNCRGAWALRESYGDPEVWEKAAIMAGPLSDHMWLLAASQHLALGRADAAIAALGSIKDAGPLAGCTAQLAVAAGTAEMAVLQTDGGVSSPALGLGLAEAHFVAGRWKEAAQHASEVVDAQPKDSELQTRAALLLVASRLAAGESAERLEQLWGEVPPFDGLGDDPVQTARWFARAALDQRDNEVDRWVSPSELPLYPGSEATLFFVAGRLAPPGSVEMWLDTLTPAGKLDPVGVAVGRRVAAGLRGDASGVSRWRAVEERLEVHTLSGVRVLRRARARMAE